MSFARPTHLALLAAMVVLPACTEERPPPFDPYADDDSSKDEPEPADESGGSAGSESTGDGDGESTGGSSSGGSAASGGSQGLGGSPGGSANAFFFRGPWLAHGDSAGRAGLDVLCRNSAPATLEGKTIHAFVSVSDDDEIRDMPANYGVPTDESFYAPDGTLLVSSWSSLLTGDVPWEDCSVGNVPLLSLFEDIAAPLYVTGSDRYGALADNCEQWSNDGGVLEIGETLYFASGIYEAEDCTVLGGTSDTCEFPGGEPYVLCLAY